MWHESLTCETCGMISNMSYHMCALAGIWVLWYNMWYWVLWYNMWHAMWDVWSGRYLGGMMLAGLAANFLGRFCINVCLPVHECMSSCAWMYVFLCMNVCLPHTKHFPQHTHVHEWYSLGRAALCSLYFATPVWNPMILSHKKNQGEHCDMTHVTWLMWHDSCDMTHCMEECCDAYQCGMWQKSYRAAQWQKGWQPLVGSLQGNGWQALEGSLHGAPYMECTMRVSHW